MEHNWEDMIDRVVCGDSRVVLEQIPDGVTLSMDFSFVKIFEGGDAKWVK